MNGPYRNLSQCIIVTLSDWFYNHYSACRLSVNNLIGTVEIGESTTSETGILHWQDAINSPEENTTHWHCIVPEEVQDSQEAWSHNYYYSYNYSYSHLLFVFFFALFKLLLVFDVWCLCELIKLQRNQFLTGGHDIKLFLLVFVWS